MSVLTSRDRETVASKAPDSTTYPDEVKAKVFESFFTTKDVGKDTGQGLSITYDVIVKLHRGSIDIQSTVGERTLFELCLPRRVKAENNSIHPLAIVPVDSGPTTTPVETF